MSTSSSTLKALQTSTLTTLLSSPTQPWKILIYDPHCRSIVSPLLTVSGLRSRGVTLHLALDSNRGSVPGVEVVYFVEATESNVQRIISDISSNLYTSDIHIFFPSKLPRPLLETLGRGLHSLNAVNRVKTLQDVYCDFRCQLDLFDLMVPGSFKRSIGGSESEMEQFCTLVSSKLLSLLSVLKIVPIIRTPPNSCSSLIAKKTSLLLKDHPITGPRVPLIICDRDLYPDGLWWHESCYLPLLYDVLDGKGEKVGNVDISSGEFLREYGYKSFPDVVEGNSTVLKGIEQSEARLRNAGEVSDLQNAVDDLPKLMEKKKEVESHTGLLQAAMEKVRQIKRNDEISPALTTHSQIGERQIPMLVDLESRLSSSSDKVASEITEILKGEGSREDKLRLASIAGLKGFSSSVVESWFGLIPDSTAYLEFVMQRRSLKMDVKPSPPTSSHGGDLLAGVGSVLGGVGAKLIDEAGRKVERLKGKGGMRDFARSVASVLEGGEKDGEWEYWDCKLRNPLVYDVGDRPGGGGGRGEGLLF
ncbi:hypothetical protein TL16_g08840 [Triparma laevis f. inornata]|uniref:Uncharacterized protein n=1 Tax=Triparma laevis f. inornata TaxID=1714386 RepID=A0A9W7B7S1_9STRA|nr:hypothetical protein TL16_g08840 [Triparma laevis f. inornata]